VNPIDELASLLPPAPPSRDLPHRDQHEADLLALIGSAPAGKSGAPAADSRLPVTRHWTVPAGSFTSVVVSTNNGPVTVTGGTAKSAAVTATPSYRGAAPMISYLIADRALTVRATRPQERDCQVALQLQVPAGVSVRAATDLGTVRLTGLTSGAPADSQLGSIYLSRVTGLVRAQTELGQISATGLTAYRATLTTAQGSVDAAFVVASELVTASSQLGSVTLHLPGNSSYAVTASADLGSTSVTVPRSSSSRHVVKAHSGLGSVTVTG
jgi:Putative adhesin